MTGTSNDFPDDENGDVLRRMQQGGDDFTKARDVDFSVVFPDEGAAEEFADHMRQAGFTVSVEDWDRNGELLWDVTVSRYMLPTHAGITEMEDRLEVAAAPLEGRNDGWGCIRQSIEH